MRPKRTPPRHAPPGHAPGANQGSGARLTCASKAVVVPRATLGLIAVLGACELEEVTIVQVEPVVVAEIYADAEPDGTNEVRAFLHRTVGIDTTGLSNLEDSRITVRSEAGVSFPLTSAALGDCVESFPSITGEAGACFLSDDVYASEIRPGEVLEVDVALPGGGRLQGAARLPAPFALPGFPRLCRLPPNTLLPVRWTRSEGAWAYVNETSIRGLPDALRSEGIDVVEDPLYLLGLSISDVDTTIVFPSEFGLFNRFDLDQDVAVRLQRGLPQNAISEITITAVEGNYVNWARGGNFNPSGQVRVPSLRGDGTGVFGATFNQRFFVVSEQDPSGDPSCPLSRDP